MHPAGGEEHEGFRLDAHSGLACPDLMDAARQVVPRLRNLGAITFEITPEAVARVGLSGLRRQLEQIRRLWESVPDPGDAVRRTAGRWGPELRPAAAADASASAWEADIGAAVACYPAPMSHAQDPAWWGSALPSLRLYRRLAQESRGGMLTCVVPETLRVILARDGPSSLRELLTSFWAEHAQRYTALEEGLRFLDSCTGGSARPT